MLPHVLMFYNPMKLPPIWNAFLTSAFCEEAISAFYSIQFCTVNIVKITQKGVQNEVADSMPRRNNM